MLLLAQLPTSIALSDVIVIGILTIISGALTNYMVSKSAQAEFKGTITATVTAIDERVDRFEDNFNEVHSSLRRADKENDDKIHNVEVDVGRLKERLDIKSRAHQAH